MKLVIIIPAYNESKIIYSVVSSLPKKLSNISKIIPLVVDDGSKDNTGEVAQKAGAKVIRHMLNRGVGAGTKTGMTWAKKQKADIAVTFDGDGQHDSGDIIKIIEKIIKKEADVVIGSRFKNIQKVPLDRMFLNWCANLITYTFFGVFSTDTQSGLRAFSKKAINSLNFRSDRMEFSSEVLLEAKKNKLKVIEVPTAAIYTKYSRTKGQKNTNAIPIMFKFMVKWLR